MIYLQKTGLIRKICKLFPPSEPPQVSSFPAFVLGLLESWSLEFVSVTGARRISWIHQAHVTPRPESVVRRGGCSYRLEKRSEIVKGHFEAATRLLVFRSFRGDVISLLPVRNLSASIAAKNSSGRSRFPMKIIFHLPFACQPLQLPCSGNFTPKA